MTFQSDELAHDQNEAIDNACAFAGQGNAAGRAAPGHRSNAKGYRPRLGISGRLGRRAIDIDRLDLAVSALAAIRSFCVEAANKSMPVLAHVDADGLASLLGLVVQEMRAASGEASLDDHFCRSN